MKQISYFIILLIASLSCKTKTNINSSVKVLPIILQKNTNFNCDTIKEVLWYQVGSWIINRYSDTLEVSDFWIEGNPLVYEKDIEKSRSKLKLIENGVCEGDDNDGFGLYPIKGFFQISEDTIEFTYQDSEKKIKNYKVIVFCKDDILVLIGINLGSIEIYTQRNKVTYYDEFINNDKDFAWNLYHNCIESKAKDKYLYVKKEYSHSNGLQLKMLK